VNEKLESLYGYVSISLRSRFVAPVFRSFSTGRFNVTGVVILSAMMNNVTIEVGESTFYKELHKSNKE